MTATLLNEFTAACERCGCMWDSACPGGCAWDQEAWAQGKALCTACVSMTTASTSPASVVSALSNEQVLELMRQDLRTTVPAFRAKLEAALGVSVDDMIRRRIEALQDEALGQFARKCAAVWFEPGVPLEIAYAKVRVEVADLVLTQESRHG